MYKLLRTGLLGQKQRVLAPEGIEAGEEFDRLAVDLHTFVRRAHKTGFVAARRAEAREPVVTRWNGTETTNTAEPGDWIVANLDTRRAVLRDKAGNANVYVIGAGKFPVLYEPERGASGHGAAEFGSTFRATGEVDALYASGGFTILAPWGEMQQADDGYLLRNGQEVYGNNRETFERTYAFNV